MQDDKVIDLIMKVKALADRGLGGERTAAMRKLELLMKKHNITLEDIDSEKKLVQTCVYQRRYKRIMIQVICMVMGGDVSIYINRLRKSSYKVETTDAQFLEIMALYDHYSRAFEKDYKIFREAFIQKNNLLPRDCGTTDLEKLSPAEKAKLMKTLEMMHGIERSEYHKQLAS